MKRKIVHIDEEKCNGCGLCVQACHEGAIVMIDGKAKLIRDDYCDGLGDCLPACPVDAIQIIERKALPFDIEAVKKRQAELKKSGQQGGCPGTQAKALNVAQDKSTCDCSDDKDNSSCDCSGSAEAENPACDCSGDKKEKNNPTTKLEDLPCGCPGTQSKAFARNADIEATTHQSKSQLMQWPVQIKLVPTNASYFNGAKLLVAADCSAYAYAGFHEKFIKGHITLIGCPKLDTVDYTEKLTEIIKHNNIKSLTVVRMEVPCCGGLEHAAVRALQNSGKFIPWQIVTLSTDGKILD